MKAFLEYSRRTAADLLFPRRCPVCGGVAMPKGRLICPACLKQLSFVSSPACMKCGKEIGSRDQEYCADCIRRKKSFTRGFALLNYDSRAAVSMAAVKYHNKREYLDFYARAAALRFEKQFRQAGIQVIVPVPVHASRLKTRGFNQAAVLAEKLSAELGIPWEELLIRVKKTDPQKSLGSAERLKNLRGAFEAEQEAGKWERVLLVDDIYTTGSTAEICSRALLKTGVKQVFVFAVCIGHGV
ncbi:ComF family protein [Clostridiaceae bacterium Marseille-Q3526]|nr:ComF family protein [Clostridiaceae bacterium Marseille-Q3526]